VMFEDLGAQDISAEQAYLSGCAVSDVYMGIWGHRYGVRMPDGYSATHAEFLEAERNGLRLCLLSTARLGRIRRRSARSHPKCAQSVHDQPWSDRAILKSGPCRLEDLAPRSWRRGTRRPHYFSGQLRSSTTAGRSRSRRMSAAMQSIRSWCACAINGPAASRSPHR